MDRGDSSQNHDDGEQNHVGEGPAVNELVLALHMMLPWLEIDQLRGLADNQLPQQEEAVDVPVGGIEINPPQEIARPWENNRAEMGVGHNRERNPPQQIERPLYNNGAGDFELNPAEQEEDPIIDEVRWWEDDGSESDTESVPDSDTESVPDSDTESVPDSDTDDSDDDGDNAQDAPVLLPPSPVPGGSRRRPREEEDEEEEDGRARKMSKH
ncbi:beta-1,3-galactosyl-O-glycosyl-glycoprotein beta-1,6-N-acetylglucosaminyltransferase [Sarotherodon galilaeus]